jgi:hypothetical protein
MYHAARAALDRADVGRSEWSHLALQAAFATQLISRRKIYPSMFRDYLSTGLRVRHQADYGGGVSRKTTERLVHKAAALLAAIAKQVES